MGLVGTGTPVADEHACAQRFRENLHGRKCNPSDYTRSPRMQGIPSIERVGYDWSVSPPPSQLPMGISEQYMTPHARFPVASPVVAAELLSFRLKGGKSRSSSSGGTSSGKQRATGGVRSGKYGLLLQRDD